MYSRALRPSEINLGFRVQGVGFSRSRIDLERAWGSGLGVLQEQDLDQPLEVDPARSSAAMEHLAKRSLCARVVIGEQAPGEVRVARREDRKVRVRQLAFTTSCPRDVPSGSIALGLFPMHPCSRPRATTSLQPLTTRKTSCTNHPTRKEQGGRGLQSRGCSDICNIACLLSHSPLIGSPPVPPPAEAEHILYNCAHLLVVRDSVHIHTRVQISDYQLGLQKHFS